jgi:hypothetical protein
MKMHFSNDFSAFSNPTQNNNQQRAVTLTADNYDTDIEELDTRRHKAQ